MKHCSVRSGLVFGLVILFVGASIMSALNTNHSLIAHPMDRVKWIYVGGSGPENYTRIQDAINDSVNGDTVYVYDDSSPYYENIVIQKSITLIGEDKLSTEINGSFLEDSLDTINITGDHVTVGGFRITNNRGYYYQGAIKIIGDYVAINNCIIDSNEWIGIYLYGASSCQISDCELYENLVAINLVYSTYNKIQNCSCHDNSDAIILSQSSDTNQIINSTCKRNSFDSLHIQQSSDNQITGCVCQNNNQGITLAYAPNTTMHNNIMSDNYVSFGIGSTFLQDYFCDIDTSNTINEKPMYYLIGQHDLSFDEDIGIGFLGLVSCQNITVKNLGFSNNFEGMLIAGTSNSSIENCSFSNNDGHGMYIISSVDNTVKNCTFRNSFWDGIFLYYSSDNTIQNCSCDNSIAGVSLSSSTHNTIKGQTVDHCSVGISLDASGSNVLKDNEMSRCGLKIVGGTLADYINDADTSNSVNGKPIYYCLNETNRMIPSDAGQVILINCSSCNASHLDLSNASIGIELAYSRTNTITHNTIDTNSLVAIYLDGSDNNDNLIKENILRENNYGIDLDSSHYNIISGNILSGNGLGFSLSSSTENTLIGNTIQDGYYGVYLEDSRFNTLTDNTIRNASIFGLFLFTSSQNVLKTNKMTDCSLQVYGSILPDYYNDVDTTNTVNEKPLYYYIGKTDRTLPQDAGQVILIDCSRCTIEKLNLNKGTIGITLAYSSNNIISGNTIKNQSMTALDLGHPVNNDNTIQGNILQENSYGIDLEFSEGNTMKRNQIVSNDNGVFLYLALNTTIQRNTISKNNLGIRTIESPGSIVRWNNIYSNYLYGLYTESCSVSARWNWWGAVAGPSIKVSGNGDQIHFIKNGHVTYKPWKVLPVFFTGKKYSSITTDTQKNFINVPFTTAGTMIVDLNQISSDLTALCGMKNKRVTKDHAIPPTAEVALTLGTHFP